MTRHDQISDECVDSLVELFFLALPSLDGPELSVLLNVVMRVVQQEVHSAVARERAYFAEKVMPCRN